MKIGFAVWIGLLLIEILWFWSLIDGPYAPVDYLFLLTNIVITLVVGTVGLIVFKPKP